MIHLKRRNFLSTQVIQLSYLPRLSTRVIGPSSPPGFFALVIRLGYPGYLMLPNLTNHFNKLSDGDLQCE